MSGKDRCGKPAVVWAKGKSLATARLLGFRETARCHGAEVGGSCSSCCLSLRSSSSSSRFRASASSLACRSWSSRDSACSLACRSVSKVAMCSPVAGSIQFSSASCHSRIRLRGYFLAHAHIDNYHISLGSWYGEGGTTLCYNPTTMSTPNPGAVLYRFPNQSAG